MKLEASPICQLFIFLVHVKILNNIANLSYCSSHIAFLIFQILTNSTIFKQCVSTHTKTFLCGHKVLGLDSKYLDQVNTSRMLYYLNSKHFLNLD